MIPVWKLKPWKLPFQIMGKKLITISTGGFPGFLNHQPYLDIRFYHGLSMNCIRLTNMVWTAVSHENVKVHGLVAQSGIAPQGNREIPGESTCTTSRGNKKHAWAICKSPMAYIIPIGEIICIYLQTMSIHIYRYIYILMIKYLYIYISINL